MNNKKLYILFLLLLLAISAFLCFRVYYRSLDNNHTEIKIDYEDMQIASNEVSDVPITIENVMEGEDLLKTFTYHLKIDNFTGELTYSSTGKSGVLVFNDGETSFELESNQSITIYSVPLDSNIKISQDALEDVSSESSVYEGIVTKIATITFKNKEIINSSNPNTIDYVSVILLFFIESMLILVILKNTKIVKYKNEEID